MTGFSEISAPVFWQNDIRPDYEPHKILILRGQRSDEKRRGRLVPYKIYYPVNHSMTNLPVIVWSHGLGGSCDGAAFLGRFIASHGYVVVHVQHPGSDAGLWQGKPGHPWDVIRSTHISRRMTLARFRDVPFMLDELPVICREHPEMGVHADLSRMGMSGHSFGAITTQVMAGQKLGRGRRMYDLHEPRFKAAIAYSPSPAYNRDEDPQEIYGGIRIPVFFMTGTDDSSPVSGRDYTHRLPIYEHAGGQEQHLLVLNGADHMVFTGSRGQLGENPNRGVYEEIIKISALAFWNAYLKDDLGARQWLTGPGYRDYLGTHGTYTNRAMTGRI